jgi:hypothetical protein
MLAPQMAAFDTQSLAMKETLTKAACLKLGTLFNDPQVHTPAVIKDQVDDYISKTDASLSVLFVALFFLDKLWQANGSWDAIVKESGVEMTRDQFLVVALCIADDLQEDQPCRHNDWIKIGGLGQGEFAPIQKWILGALNYRLYVETATLKSFAECCNDEMKKRDGQRVIQNSRGHSRCRDGTSPRPTTRQPVPQTKDDVKQAAGGFGGMHSGGESDAAWRKCSESTPAPTLTSSTSNTSRFAPQQERQPGLVKGFSAPGQPQTYNQTTPEKVGPSRLLSQSQSASQPFSLRNLPNSASSVAGARGKPTSSPTSPLAAFERPSPFQGNRAQNHPSQPHSAPATTRGMPGPSRYACNVQIQRGQSPGFHPTPRMFG